MTIYEYVFTIFERNTVIWSVVFWILMVFSTVMMSYALGTPPADAGVPTGAVLGVFLIVWHAFLCDIFYRVTST
jgi:hypothetical protein